jgi:hypothetical protein
MPMQGSFIDRLNQFNFVKTNRTVPVAKMPALLGSLLMCIAMLSCWEASNQIVPQAGLKRRQSSCGHLTPLPAVHVFS